MESEGHLGIADPTDFFKLRHVPTLKQRRESLIRLSKNLGLAGAERNKLFVSYAEQAGLKLSGLEA